MNPQRLDKIKKLAYQRQQGFTIILENVIDPHNMGAVVRTCDAVGISEIFLVYSDHNLIPEELAVGKITGAGARKWVDVHYYENLDLAFSDIRSKYETIFATHLGVASKSLYHTDLTQSIALLFGNEKNGISDDALYRTDGNVVLPQMGMVQSLNISVACAVSLYEMLRQRTAAQMYASDYPDMQEYRSALCQEYIRRSDDGHVGREVIRH